MVLEDLVLLVEVGRSHFFVVVIDAVVVAVVRAVFIFVAYVVLIGALDSVLLRRDVVVARSFLVALSFFKTRNRTKRHKVWNVFC